MRGDSEDDREDRAESAGRGIHWFRNDLRLHDNTALAALADRVEAWLPVFVLDPELLGAGGRETPRARFLLGCVDRLGDALARRGVPLQILEGEPAKVLPELVRASGARVVSWNVGATPLARRRDERVRRVLEDAGIEVVTCRDHTVFGPGEIRTGKGDPYSVYTPYRNAWWSRWQEAPRWSAARSRIPKATIPPGRGRRARFASLGAEDEAAAQLPTPGEDAARRRLRAFLSGPARRYHLDRDRPDIDGTSRLSPYLRFGAISARHCVSEGLRAIEADPALEAGISKWLDEIVWREFYAAVLENEPRVLGESYRREYDGVRWSRDESHFEAWCEGRTGYPFVDAGMRQLRETGWMHNRVRMIVASFLTKHLLIDWRRGERHFFEALVDGDPASNNGGWQWAASTGTDPQPYFRIFNPVSQGERWDPEGRYVRRWVPELRDLDARVLHAPWKADRPIPGYPAPIVEHKAARERALEAFAAARAEKQVDGAGR